MEETGAATRVPPQETAQKGSGKGSGKSSGELLDIIQQESRITIPEMADMLGKSSRTIEKNLARLRKGRQSGTGRTGKRGLLEDPGGA